MKSLSKKQNLLFRLGALMMVAGAGTYLFGGIVSNVVFGVGALLFVAMQLQTVYEGRNFVIIRLRRQQLLGAAALVLAVAAQTYQTLGHYVVRYNEWVVCLLVGAVLEFYTAVRIPQEMKKEES